MPYQLLFSSENSNIPPNDEIPNCVFQEEFTSRIIYPDFEIENKFVNVP